MSWGIIFIFIVGFAMAGSGIVQSHVAKQQLNYWAYSSMTFFMGSICSFCLLLWVHQKSPIQEIPHYKGTIVMIALAGFTGSFAFAFIQYAMRKGIHGIVWAITQLAMVIPFISAGLIFDEPWSLAKLIGVGAIASSVIFFAFGRFQGEINTLKGHEGMGWLGLTLIAFLLIGASMAFSSVPSYWGVEQSEGSRYLRAFVYLFSVFIVYFSGKIITQHRLTRREFKASCFHFAMAMTASNLTYVTLDKLGEVGAAGIVFPVVTIVSIIGVAIYGKFVLREVYTRYHISGMILGILGIVFLAVLG